MLFRQSGLSLSTLDGIREPGGKVKDVAVGLRPLGKIRHICTLSTTIIRGLVHMSIPILLASGSAIRARMLANAGVAFKTEVPRIDEQSAKTSLLNDGAAPRDIADALAGMKAAKISARHPDAMVIGCDQVLDVDGSLLSKPVSPEDAIRQLVRMRGKSHELLSAAVICEAGRPVWRHVGRVRLRMRSVSDGYLATYVVRNWDSIRDSVGAYKLEEEGVRLFDGIDGDYFTVLGMPLLELLKYLSQRGVLES